MTRAIRLIFAIVLCLPTAVRGADADNDAVVAPSGAPDATAEPDAGAADDDTRQLMAMFDAIDALGWGTSENAERKAIYDEVDELLKQINSTTDDLRKNAQAMRDKEQSDANRLLGASSMAMTGIGGMQALSGLAEKNADADAERDMAAYLATFRCDYGGGAIVKGGETAIILPGANTLAPLYQEYTTLADDLKERKAALGLRPGIEAEVVIDKAASGLYDDVGTGITNGTYASVARALMDENSADAAAWNTQKETSAQKLKTGAILAGTGVVGGIAGNLIINRKAEKENSAEILERRDTAKQKLGDIIRKEIETCNDKITQAQELAAQIQADSLLMSDEDLAEFVADVNALSPLADNADITQIKEHPLCR